MRILFLTPELPYPARGGGTIKSSALLDHLKERHEVDLMCLRGPSASEERPPWARELGTVVIARVHGRRTPANLLRSYAAGIPLSILRNRSARFAELVRDHARGRPIDAIVADSWLMAQHVPSDFHGLGALHQHNAEFVMWEREAALESNPVRRSLIRTEAKRVRRYEASILSGFRAVFAVSEPDRRALRGLVADPPRMELLPNVPEPGLLDRPSLSPSDAEPIMLFLGTLSWPPNVRGLRLFLRDVLPLVNARIPRARLVVAGRGAPRDLATLIHRTEGVDLVGPIADPEPLYRRARAFVETTRGGSGTRVKVLNALARGLPVVTTPDGAEGLDIRPGEHALVGSTPEELSGALERVMSDDALWTALSETGRRLVRQRYVPEVAFAPLDQVFGA